MSNLEPLIPAGFARLSKTRLADGARAFWHGFLVASASLLNSAGLALGSFTHWVFAAAISQTFPLFAERSGGKIFAFYAASMVGQLLWVLLVMPETKGIPLEEIQKRLRIE